MYNIRKRVLSAVTVCTMLMCSLIAVPVYAEKKQPFKEMKLPGDVWACDFDRGDELVSYYTVSEGVGNSSYRTGVDMRLFDYSFGVGTAFVQGDWANYTFTVEKSGFYVPTIYYATPEENVSFSLETGETVQTVTLEPTQDYTTAASYIGDNIYFAEGKHTLKIRWVSGGVTFYKISFGAAGSGTGLQRLPLPQSLQGQPTDPSAAGKPFAKASALCSGNAHRLPQKRTLSNRTAQKPGTAGGNFGGSAAAGRVPGGAAAAVSVFVRFSAGAV